MNEVLEAAARSCILFLQAKVTRQIFTLAWPAVLGASIDPVLSLLDTYWVSRCLGMLSLAALGPALNVEDYLLGSCCCCSEVD